MDARNSRTACLNKEIPRVGEASRPKSPAVLVAVVETFGLWQVDITLEIRTIDDGGCSRVDRGFIGLFLDRGSRATGRFRMLGAGAGDTPF